MPLSRWQPPVLRGDAEESHRVTWLELFFDLVFVASLIQLGNVLADDLTWAGAGRFVALFVLLWWNWSGTTVFVNRVAVDDWPHRLLVIGQMFAVASLAAHVPVAFEDGIGFAVSYLAARAALVGMWLHARRSIPEASALADHWVRMLVIGMATWGVSLLVPTPARWWLWALAMVVEGAGTASRLVRTSFATSGHGELEHLQERMALFTIIVLGEGFVKATDTLAEGTLTGEALVFGILGIAIMSALWWTYFDDVADAAVRTEERWLYTWSYAHMPLAAAITAFGVSLKKLVDLESFADPIKLDKALLLGIAVAVTLLATALMDVATRPQHFAVNVRHRVVPRLVGAGVILLWVPLTASGPGLLFVGGIAVIAVAQIGIEVAVAVRGDRWVAGRVAESLTPDGELCEHLESIPVQTADKLECAPCSAEGKHWVQLRICVTCGHVGCCDDSEGQHATKHWQGTGHPVMRTGEPDAHWAWCYEDECTLDDWRPRRATAAH